MGAGQHDRVPVPSRDPVAEVAAVGRQDIPEHDPAQTEQPGPDHLLSGLQAGITAAQNPGRLGGEPGYLGCPLLRERVPEPPFSPPVPVEASPPTPPGRTGRAERIA